MDGFRFGSCDRGESDRQGKIRHGIQVTLRMYNEASRSAYQYRLQGLLLTHQSDTAHPSPCYRIDVVLVIDIERDLIPRILARLFELNDSLISC